MLSSTYACSREANSATSSGICQLNLIDIVILYLSCTLIDFREIWYLIQAPEYWVKPRRKYVPLKEPFASKKLRVIEVKCEKFDVRVHHISRMLSIYNAYLEKVTIECSGRCSECKLAIFTFLVSFSLMHSQKQELCEAMRHQLNVLELS